MVLSEPASVSIAALAPRVDACELCGTAGEALRAAVTVRHARGGTVSLAACDRCAAAMRRVVALAGSAFLTLAAVDVAPSAASEPPTDLVGNATLVHEYAEPFVADDGATYLVRVWGQARSDGTWIGWLTFVGVDNTVVRKTPRETSQSSLDHLTYWASGLQASYFPGAFLRAT